MLHIHAELPSRRCDTTEIRWHTRRVKGLWVGRTVEDVLKSILWPRHGETDDEIVRAIAIAASDLRIRVFQETGDCRKNRSEPSSASTNESTLTCVSEGPSVLLWKLNLRQVLSVGVHLDEPACLDLGPIAIVEIIDLSAIVPADGNSDAHLLVVVDKPPSIPVHPGGRYVHHTVLGLVARGEYDDAATVFRTFVVDSATTIQQEIDLGKQSALREALRIASKNTHASSMFDTSTVGILPPLSLRAVHRLDRGTSGLLMLATSAPAAHLVTRAIDASTLAAGEKKKEYEALLETSVESLAPLRRETPILDVKSPGRELQACTEIQPLLRLEHSLTLARCYLERGGRRHQIRIHCAEAGMPIVGDSEHGSLGLLRPAKAVRSSWLHVFSHGCYLGHPRSENANADAGRCAVIALRSLTYSLQLGGCAITLAVAAESRVAFSTLMRQWNSV